MPETDLHFRYLLAAGLQQNAWLRTIVFVNPDAAGLEARARAVLRGSYIDQGLIRFAKLSSEQFAAGLLAHGRIGVCSVPDKQVHGRSTVLVLHVPHNGAHALVRCRLAA